MLLAYVFWHRPRAGVGREDYEARLGAFHARLGESVEASATFRVAALPFVGGGEAYEDWYLVADWTALGALEEAAVSGRRREPHDAAAAAAADGWAAVYGLLRGEAVPPDVAQWASKPAGESYDDFLTRENAPAVWQRRLVLGPTPEFCLGAPGAQPGRERVAGS